MFTSAARAIPASGAPAKLPVPMIERLIEDIANGLGQWAYLLVAFMAMAETAAFLGFIAPGEFTIILGGVLAGEGTLSIQLLIGIVWVVVRDRRLDRVLPRPPARARLHPQARARRCGSRRSASRRSRSSSRRHGGKTIFIGRWLGFVRPLMPFTAGASGMTYRRFLPYDVLGAGLWATTLCLLGYIFWHSFEQVASDRGPRRDRVRGPARAVRRRLPGVQAPAPSRAAPGVRALARAAGRSGPLLRPLAWLVRGARAGCCGRSGATCCGRCGC